MKGSSVCLALSMVLLAGCSTVSTNTKTNDAATYEAYKATVEQLDQVKAITFLLFPMIRLCK